MEPPTVRDPNVPVPKVLPLSLPQPPGGVSCPWGLISPSPAGQALQGLAWSHICITLFGGMKALETWAEAHKPLRWAAPSPPPCPAGSLLPGFRLSLLGWPCRSPAPSWWWAWPWPQQGDGALAGRSPCGSYTGSDPGSNRSHTGAGGPGRGRDGSPVYLALEAGTRPPSRPPDVLGAIFMCCWKPGLQPEPEGEVSRARGSGPGEHGHSQQTGGQTRTVGGGAWPPPPSGLEVTVDWSATGRLKSED